MPTANVGGWTSATLVPGARAYASPEASLNSAYATPATASTATAGPGSNPVVAPDALSSIMSQIFGPNYASLLNAGQSPVGTPGSSSSTGPDPLQQAYVANLNARTAAIGAPGAAAFQAQWLAPHLSAANQNASGGDFGSGVNGMTSPWQNSIQAQWAQAIDPALAQQRSQVAAAAARSPMPMLPGQGPQGNSLMLPPSGWTAPASFTWTPPNQNNTNMPGQANSSAQLMGRGV